MISPCAILGCAADQAETCRIRLGNTEYLGVECLQLPRTRTLESIKKSRSLMICSLFLENKPYTTVPCLVPCLVWCVLQVVTVNYRLAVLGFLGSDKLRSRDAANGSTGMVA